MPGPGDPPKEYQFKPGQSGNPKGRPKGTGITDRLRELVMGDDKGAKQLRDDLAKAATIAATNGDHRFWKEIVDRLEGKVTDRTEISGAGGEALGLTINIVKDRDAKDEQDRDLDG